MFGLDRQDEEKLHETLSWCIILSSPFVFLACLYLKAPWGKTGTDQWWIRPVLPPRISWFIFESPNLVWAFVCWRNAPPPDALNRGLLLLFILHYIQRAIIYPLLMSKTSKRLPLLMAFSALGYCSLNGYLQARSICLSHPVPQSYMYNPLFYLGVAFFLTGVTINLHSDSILRGLRRTTTSTTNSSASTAAKQSHYKIPRGGMFEYVSAPHFLGEIMEWTGFALLNQGSLASVSLAVFTAANLIPRAVAHHEWYRERFGVSSRDNDDDDDDHRYPRTRRAIIPFVW